jgi:cell division protein ZapD
MINSIIYEHPLHERNRTFMRLEYLFDKMDHFLIRNSSLDLFIVIQTFIEIINILERNDISTDVIKELDRYHISLSKLLDATSVDKETLEITLQALTNQLTDMQTNFGKHTKQLRNDELLNLIRQKMAISPNLCSFDIPGLYYWIHQNHDIQQKQLHSWLEELAIMKASIKLIMQLIRDSVTFVRHSASCGFFQTAFKHNAHYQIIRIRLPNTVSVFPEISGNKHRITVRFLNFTEASGRPQQTTEDVNFELSCCYL